MGGSWLTFHDGKPSILCRDGLNSLPCHRACIPTRYASDEEGVQALDDIDPFKMPEESMIPGGGRGRAYPACIGRA